MTHPDDERLQELEKLGGLAAVALGADAEKDPWLRQALTGRNHWRKVQSLAEQRHNEKKRQTGEGDPDPDYEPTDEADPRAPPPKEPEPPPEPFPQVDIWAELPPVPWLVEGLDLCPEVCHLLAGYGYSGKTVAAQAMAFAVASEDLNLWDNFRIKHGRAKHIDYEQGPRLCAERYQRLARGYGVLPDKIRERLVLVSRPPLYLDSQGAEAVYLRECEEFDLLIVDSLRASCPSIDENSSEVRRVLDLLSKVSEKTGCTPLVIHHARKPSPESTGGARMAVRGSGALYDAVGSCLVFEAAKGQPIRVHHEKARTSGKLAEDFWLRIDDVEVEQNRRGGLVVSAGAIPAPNLDVLARADLDALKKRIRELFQEKPEQPSKEAIRAQLGARRSDVWGALDLMVADGEIKATGTTTDRRFVYVESESE